MVLCALVDISPQHSLKGLGEEAPLDDQARLAIQVAAGSQLGQQEGLHVLQLTVHGLAQLQEVGEHRLLRAFTRHLHERLKPMTPPAYRGNSRTWTYILQT